MKVTLALASVLTLAFAGPAAAAEQVLKVSVVHATKAKKPHVDPKLKRIRKSLQKAFGGYTKFVSLQRHELKLNPKATVTLPGGRKAVFAYKGTQKNQVRLNLAIPKSKVNVDLRSPPGRVFYQAGLKHKNGILILALYLKPPKK